jgi:uncharacterized membrane protein YdjX (TVP38/TMEM64 family)
LENLNRTAAVLLLMLIVSLLAWSYLDGGIASVLLDSGRSSEERIESLRQYFIDFQEAAPLIYIAIVIVEVVVAPIPGTLLYLPGGAVFGGLLGGVLSLIGNVLGAGISCQLMRSIVGRKATASFFQQKGLARYSSMIEKQGFFIVLLLRLNPLTSSDLVSYAAGLTAMPVSTLMVATCIGMTPLCFAQAYLSAAILDTFPWLIWPLIAICLVYAVTVLIVIWRLRPAARD